MDGTSPKAKKSEKKLRGRPPSAEGPGRPVPAWLSPSTIERLDARAAARGVKRADLIRQYIERGLAAGD